MIRVGIGYDCHRLVEGRKLIIGGVEIPYEKGLVGFSDADVLTHAIMDAVLGAVHAPDIGVLFPQIPEYKGISSLKLLSKVADMIRGNGYEVEYVDSVVIAEEPQLSGYVKKIEEILSMTMNIEMTRVNVKATTTEGLGFEGEGLGISAQAIVTVIGSDHRNTKTL